MAQNRKNIKQNLNLDIKIFTDEEGKPEKQKPKVNNEVKISAVQKRKLIGLKCDLRKDHSLRQPCNDLQSTKSRNSTIRLSHRKPNLERTLQRSNDIYQSGQTLLASTSRSLDMSRSRN